MNKNEFSIAAPQSFEGGHLIKFLVQFDDKQQEIYFRSENTNLTPNIEAIVAPMILPAMTTGRKILLDSVISQKFIDNLSVVQDIFHNWEPSSQKIEVRGAKPVQAQANNTERVGAFFTCGVDSFYTLLKHQDEITDLIYIHGYDIPLEKKYNLAQVSKRIHRVAAALGKNLIEIETNLEPFIGNYSGWVNYNLGAALASAGHLLAPQIKRIYIPSTYCYQDLVPMGSHPLLDPLWSSESLEFIHDGLEATRVEKLRAISDHDVAMQNLRVCWENFNDAYNCCACGKCTRTMVALRIVGADKKCTTFDSPINSRIIATMDGTGELRPFLFEMKKALEEMDRDEDRILIKGLNTALKGKSWPIKLKQRISSRLSRYPRVFQLIQFFYIKVCGIIEGPK